MTTSLTAQHIASSTAPCGLTPHLLISPYVVAEEGYCLAVRALDAKEVYNQLEGTGGVFRTIQQGDVLAGALGERQALKGYSGRIPRTIRPGDTLHVLNMGGILGLCTSDHPDLGPALRVEVLGAVVTGEGRHARIQDHAIDPLEHLTESAPLVFVSGTAMNTGKTYAAAELVAGLTAQGFRVAAAKLTGASLMRDVRAMAAHGAICTASFTEAGVVATTGRDMVPVAKGLIGHLNGCAPDAIVLELGDGIIGPYGVDAILQDMELQRLTAAHVLAATDLAGAWAADQLFRTRYRADLAVVVGPATDTEVGRRYLQNTLGVPGINARDEAERLSNLIASKVSRFEAPVGDGIAGPLPALADLPWEAAR
jgi:hypothetical protein